ncbi:PAS domain-containing sensor histidine kinase [Rhodoferax mekongensis]|uniref:histidine kinase n=1 Tax=Rhodoferax mekongensis TaxID=3068341 RepID=A0ABZ0B334_9BURK|nr:PAS domain-containing sensor histidine kinase [Rhodoferax sp. TBRC 17307]WNO05327.1 PAS domain-containing sensor histidine kinase [Rhodoferax sp. TBRC 17307]
MQQTPFQPLKEEKAPWSLLTQVSWLTVAVTLISLLSYGLWYESQIAQVNRSAAQAQALTLATTLATAAETAVITRDSGALEALLINMRNAPDLVQLAVFDPQGKPRAVVDVTPERAAKLNFELGPQAPPATPAIQLELVGEGDSGSIQVWAPIQVGTLAGWTRVTVNRQGEAQARALVRQQTIVSALLTSAFTSMALFVLMRNRLRPVAQCADFAQGMARNFGSALAVPVRSREVAQLQQALNGASQQLEKQYHDILERNERLDAIFALSSDGLVVFTERGELAYANPAFSTMSSVPTQPGQTCAALDAALALQCENPADYQSATVHNTDHVFTFVLVRPVRRVLRREHRVNERGQMVLYFRDITAESDVARMKSEFLTTAAHELRTPMVSIFGFVELLLKRKYTEEAQRSMLDVIYRQSKRLTTMVTELLDLARIEARAGLDFSLSEQALAPLIEQACEAVAVPQESHTLVVELPDIALCANYDADKMRQALENVLSNAIKYSPAGGEVRVSVVHGPAGQEPPWLGIAVQDQGIGMTPEQFEHAFERFYRADASGNIPGTGLGLSLVKEIVEIHGGRVELQSRPGEGTKVILWLKSATPRSAHAKT